MVESIVTSHKLHSPELHYLRCGKPPFFAGFVLFLVVVFHLFVSPRLSFSPGLPSNGSHSHAIPVTPNTNLRWICILSVNGVLHMIPQRIIMSRETQHILISPILNQKTPERNLPTVMVCLSHQPPSGIPKIGIVEKPSSLVSFLGTISNGRSILQTPPV